MPSPSRRHFLITAGLGVAALAGAGAYWAATRRPDAALEPWSAEALTRHDDPRLRAFSQAALAPNPHNRQPWLIELDAGDGATVYADPNRLLPETDPFSRQIVIGFGCFLEVLSLAAAAEGLQAEITPFPEGSDPKALDARPIAHVRFIAGAEADPLARAIRDRRTVRAPFDMARPPSTEAGERILAAARRPGLEPSIVSESAALSDIRELMWEAHVMEVETPRAYQESLDVLRIGKAEIEAQPDGIALSGAFMEGLSALGMLDHAAMADPTSTAYAQGMTMYRDLIDGTPAVFTIVSETTGRSRDARAAEIESGRAYVRAHLAATAEGLAFHPMSQALQEYPEMSALYARAHALFKAEGGTLQMLARVGAAPATDPSPRWPVESRML